jgi:DNA topoisomerase-3
MIQCTFTVQVSRDCRYLSTKVAFEVGTETFTCTGKTLLDPGYTTIMHWQAFGKNETVPPFTEGDMAKIQDVSESVEFASPLALFRQTTSYIFNIL